MHKLSLTTFSFIIACLVVIAAFMTARTYTQLAGAVLLYPLMVFFAYEVFLKKLSRPSKKAVISIQPSFKTAQKIEETKSADVGISDIDKRVFLKLIGSTGLILFLFSILNKKAENVFFKNLPMSSSGNKIDQVYNSPTDGYTISEIDNTNLIYYYGFTNRDGAWYIMKADTDTGSFRYARGGSNFILNWTNRDHLKYDYFSNVFKY